MCVHSNLLFKAVDDQWVVQALFICFLPRLAVSVIISASAIVGWQDGGGRDGEGGNVVEKAKSKSVSFVFLIVLIKGRCRRQ